MAYREQLDRKFLFDRLPSDFDQNWNLQETIRQADSILAGRWQYFFYGRYDMGFPPSWASNPSTGQQIQLDRHWSKISDFQYGDIKFYWELSRFSFVYTLARAYAYSRDERYSAAFWTLVEDWAEANPPQRGPNWKCSQEASIRLMAWCFGLYAFQHSPHTTPERQAQLVVMLAAHAERISRFLNYARSQGGNHIVAEGTALWSMGLLFPELAHAEEWREIGRRILELEAPLQIYDDGAYEMHSFNYHRSVLHTLYWAIRLGELNNAPLAQPVYDAVARSVDFLLSLMDFDSGQWPMYGRNDGSLLLPLTTCDQRDFHPTLQLGHYIVNHELLFPSGPWDEIILWFFGETALTHTEQTDIAPPASTSFRNGGYYTLRGEHSWAVIRCAIFRHRPYEADQLHLDVWWRGINTICEPGTFRYNAEGQWDHGLNKTMVHNTVCVDVEDQMLRVGRFLWLDWSKGQVTCQKCSPGQLLEYWEGEHDGYQRLKHPVTHRRGVLRVGREHWLVVDLLQSRQAHSYVLHWLLPDYPYEAGENQVTIQTERGPYQVRLGVMDAAPACSVVRAAEDQLFGWRSLYYDEKRPALSVLNRQVGASLLFWTLLGPPVGDVVLQAGQFHIQATDWQAEIALGGHQHSDPLLRVARYLDSAEDQLLIHDHSRVNPS